MGIEEEGEQKRELSRERMKGEGWEKKERKAGKKARW